MTRKKGGGGNKPPGGAGGGDSKTNQANRKDNESNDAQLLGNDPPSADNSKTKGSDDDGVMKKLARITKNGSSRRSSKSTNNAGSNINKSPDVPPPDKKKFNKNDKEGKRRFFSRGLTICGSLTAACFLLCAFPKLLHKTGVVETDVVSDIYGTYIQPDLDRTWDKVMSQIGRSNDTDFSYFANRGDRPGYKLAKAGAHAKYPVVIIPGFVTSALELWEGEQCARPYFRQKIWGSLAMAQKFLSDRECWRRHLSLDPKTGLDPENTTIRVRAALGFDAADYFMNTYWVFSKVIANLADVGYDPSNMVMMSYDWRVAFPLLEKRDSYFTRLKMTIEAFHKASGTKVALISHSMGGLTATFFFEWVSRSEKEGGGGGGKNWVDKHIHAFVNVAGSMLGVPKTVPALLSGEMKDTSVLLGPLGSFVENYFGRKKRKDMFSTWGALWSLMPKGGDAIWGVGADLLNSTTFEQINISKSSGFLGGDDQVFPVTPLVSFAADEAFNTSNECPAEIDDADEEGRRYLVNKMAQAIHLSTNDVVDFLKRWGGGLGPELASARYHDFRLPSEFKKRKPAMEDWHNPVVTPLPQAPSMRIYCLYGYGAKTERAYYYKRDRLKAQQVENVAEYESNETFSDPPFIMDLNVTDKARGVENGVLFADGDATVPLLSLGYMCADGWVNERSSHLNPSRLEVITREYPNKVTFDINDPMRGGPYNSEHCDILGHLDFLDDLVKIVTDFNISSVAQKITSNIESMANAINEHPLGGMKGS